MTCHGPGWHRVRRGRGFSYSDEAGRSPSGRELDRIRALAIPPAWTDVWICPDERGHLQAVGVDDAGRRQYLYHPEWRRKRDAEKFDRAIALGRRLPRVRDDVRRELATGRFDDATIIAATIRLLDLGCFRLGADAYTEENGSYGLTTLTVGHVGRAGDARTFGFVGKSGVEHDIVIDDPDVVAVVDHLTGRRRRTSRLLAVKTGRQWQPVNPADINERIRDLAGLDVSAKDFRTWKATTTVAAELAHVQRASGSAGRAKQVRGAMAAAADLLGNTVTVARTSYVDPRIVDLFEDGRTIGRPRSENGLDRAVVRLLTS